MARSGTRPDSTVAQLTFSSKKLMHSFRSSFVKKQFISLHKRNTCIRTSQLICIPMPKQCICISGKSYIERNTCLAKNFNCKARSGFFFGEIKQVFPYLERQKMPNDLLYITNLSKTYFQNFTGCPLFGSYFSVTYILKPR